jgi:hypothetical protein
MDDDLIGREPREFEIPLRPLGPSRLLSELLKQEDSSPYRFFWVGPSSVRRYLRVHWKWAKASDQFDIVIRLEMVSEPWAPASRPSNAGRPSFKNKPDEARIKIAKEAWEIRMEQPSLGWDKIAARVGAPTGETLRRWIEDHHLHER